MSDTKNVVSCAKDCPEDLGPNFKKLVNGVVDLINSSKTLVGILDDPNWSCFSNDKNLNKLFSDAGRNIVGALSKLSFKKFYILFKQENNTNQEDKDVYLW